MKTIADPKPCDRCGVTPTRQEQQEFLDSLQFALDNNPHWVKLDVVRQMAEGGIIPCNHCDRNGNPLNKLIETKH